MGNFAIGVILPGVGVQRRDGLTLQEAARHLEQAGLDGAWHGDHLAIGSPTLDAPVALAAAAAATTRISIGTSVFVPAIRPLAWAAKQVASLQYVSAGRLVLGVGSGGGPEQWAAAGVPYGERGPRTDTALELLPHLVAGKPTPLPVSAREDRPITEHGPAAEQGPVGEQGPVMGLAPAVEMPPVWVGNASPVAIRRAARLGDGWFPSLISPEEVATGRARLAELASGYGRRTPIIAIGGTSALGGGDGLPTREEIAAGISGAYGRPLDEVLGLPLTGSPEQAAEHLAAYREAGASHAVIGIAGGDWRTQVDALAQTRALLH